MENFWLVAVAIFSYFLGSFSTSQVVSRKKIEEWGNDSWGAMSTLQKTGSKLKGAIVVLGDAAKGFLPVFTFTSFSQFVGYNQLYALGVSSLFVVLGHNYSINLNFRGGRGLATGLGVLLALNWILGLTVLAVILASIFSVEFWMRGAFHGEFLKLARNNILGRITGIILCLVVIYLLSGADKFLVLLPMMALIIFSHKERVRNYLLENREILQKRLGLKTLAR